MSFTPYITPWKIAFPQTGFPDWWPGWTTPDIFVDNDGNRTPQIDTGPSTTGPFHYFANVNQPGEPEIGIANNRLFVVISNTGTTGGTVQVNVGFTPFAMVGGSWTQFQFKQIAQFPVTLGAAGSPTAQQQTEVQWDLSDVTDTNGGLWSLPVGAFTHFCVEVFLTPGNSAQNNFSNVISASPFPVVPLLVVNSDPEPRKYEIVAQNVPKDWSLHLYGIVKRQDYKPGAKNAKPLVNRVAAGDKVEITLEPGEERLLTFAIVHGDREIAEKNFITLGLFADGKPVGGIALNAGTARRPRRRPTRPVCSPPVLAQYLLPVFFPRKQVIYRTPFQVNTPGTILVRIAERG
jgi:hypothetical protein